MAERRVPLLLVTSLTSISYLTGFRGSAGVALFGPAEGVLWVDPRYTLQAHEQAQGMKVVEEKSSLLKAFGDWGRKHRVRWVGYDPAHLTCAGFEQLVSGIGSRGKWRRVGDLVEELRLVKGPEEIEQMRRAGRVTAEVFEEVLGQVRPGRSETDLAAEIEYRMRKKGAEGPAFETIVASGVRAALPHARASSKLLQENELVIFDLGAILGGYASDMTRTVYLGEPSRRVQSLYKAILEAQQQALAAIRPGARSGEVDAAARRCLGRRGLARFFTHSTGHGVGLEVHEKPRLGRGEKARLATGQVVTVEPGVYMEGFGGIRVEDTVLVGSSGAEILTPAPKDRWIVS